MKYYVLFFVMLLSSARAFAVQQVSDGDCELALVSQDDYEGGNSHPWLRNEDLDRGERVYREFLYKASDFLVNHYRWPDPERARKMLASAQHDADAATAMDEDDEDQDKQPLDDFALEDLLRERGPSMMADIRRLFDNRFFYLRRKIASSYIRAVRQSDIPPNYRTVPSSPSADLFFYAAIKTKTNGGPMLYRDVVRNQLTVEHFQDLFLPDRGNVRSGIFPQPLVFPNGWAEVENAARFDATFAFRGFHDTRNLLTMDRAQATLAALEKTKGFVAATWVATDPMPRDYYEALLQFVEERDWILIVGAAQQNYEGFPEDLLNNPRLHLLTHTIENRYLKLSNEPINPSIEDPLSAVMKANRYRPGQTYVVFHPHQMLKTVATDTNDTLPVTLISTGGMTEAFASYSSNSAGRMKEANREFKKTKAFIFEKGDTLSPFDPDGVQNQWHYRPLHYTEDRALSGVNGFIDLGVGYEYHYAGDERTFAKTKIPPSEIYLGDPHDPVTDPRYLQALLSLDIPKEAYITFLAGDWIDNHEISHWLDGQNVALNLQYQTGAVSALGAINGATQVMNALLQRYPNARIGIDIGNHEEWLARRMQSRTEVQDVINGDFYDELQFATRVLKLNLWDYVFFQRQPILEAMLARSPDKKATILDRIVPIYDRDRLVVMDRGQPYYSGPDWRRNLLGKHGDQATFGKKSPGLKEHAKSMPEGGGVIGHTHTNGIYAEVMNPATAGPAVAHYGQGFYSAVAQGLVMVYPNGTKQLLTYNRMTGSFTQRDPRKVLPAASFFADEPLRIVPNDNDRVDKTRATEFIRTELARLRELTGN